GHTAHQGGLAAARPALEEIEDLGVFQVDELVIKRIKARRGIGSQKKTDLRGVCHKKTSVPLRSHPTICRLRPACARRLPPGDICARIKSALYRTLEVCFSLNML